MICHTLFAFTSCAPKMKPSVHIKNMTIGSACNSMHVSKHFSLIAAANLGKDFVLYLNSKGTTQKHTVHDTPQHNGVAECCNCTIVKHVCALLHASSLPWFLWGQAAHHIVWLMDHTLTKAINGKHPTKLHLASNHTSPMHQGCAMTCVNSAQQDLKGVPWTGLQIFGCSALPVMLIALAVEHLQGQTHHTG